MNFCRASSRHAGGAHDSGAGPELARLARAALLAGGLASAAAAASAASSPVCASRRAVGRRRCLRGASGSFLQSRFERITHDLRCLVCQNESIADSNVELAADLRRQVREMLLAGQSDDAIFPTS